MPKILQQNGFVVYIYGTDHLPRHVHVHEGSFSGLLLKINLDDLGIMINTMKPGAARRAQKLIAEHREVLIEAWERIHGEP